MCFQRARVCFCNGFVGYDLYERNGVASFQGMDGSKRLSVRKELIRTVYISLLPF